MLAGMGRTLFSGSLEEVGDLGMKNFFIPIVTNVKGCEESKQVSSLPLSCPLSCSYLKHTETDKAVLSVSSPRGLHFHQIIYTELN